MLTRNVNTYLKRNDGWNLWKFWIQSTKSQIESATTDPGITGCKPKWGIKGCYLPNTLHNTMCFRASQAKWFFITLVFTPSMLSLRSQNPNFSWEQFFILFILCVITRTICKSICCRHANKCRLWDNSYRNSLHVKEKRSDLVPNANGKYKEYPIQLRYFPTTW